MEHVKSETISKFKVDSIKPKIMTTQNSVIEYERVIRTNIKPRNVLIQRNFVGGAGGTRSGSTSQSFSRSMTVGGLGSSMGGVGAGAVVDKRDQEKRDMQDLNERFAGYIEKVRFLEAQNRKLGDELENLKAKWGKQTTVIKTMYQTDLDQVKNLLDESEKETAKLQIQVAALEEKIEDVRRKLDDANHAAAEAREKLESQLQQISAMEAEVHLLRMRSDLLDGDKKVNRATISRLQDAINRAKSDLDKEIAEKEVAESQRSALEEELAFLKEIHEQELRELAAQGYFDSTAANREMWSSEMSSALKEMQQLYDEKINDLRNDLSLNFNMQVQAIQAPRAAPVGGKDEVTRIRTQVNEIRNKVMDLENKNKQIQMEIDNLRREKEDRERELMGDCDKLTNDTIAMRAEMEAILKEIQGLQDSKLGLELEIAAYRKLLEGETNSEGLKQVVENMFHTMVGGSGGGGGYGGGFGGEFGSGGGGGSGHSGFEFSSSGGGGGVGGSSSSGFKSSTSSSSARTSFQKSAKGPVSISECQADGKLIIIENIGGKKSEDLTGFSIRRNVDGREMPVFTFPSGTTVEKGSKMKLWVKGERPTGAGSEEIDTGLSTWGSGKNITTQLINSAGQDRATHIQKTM